MIEDFSTLIHACSVHWRFWAHVRCTLGSEVASFLGRTRPITPTSGLEELEKRRTWDWRRGESGKVISCDGNMNIKGLVCSFENSTGVGSWGYFVPFLCFLHLPEFHHNCKLVVYKCKSTLKRMALAGSQSSSSPPPCVALPPLQGGAANMRADDAILQINDKFT